MSLLILVLPGGAARAESRTPNQPLSALHSRVVFAAGRSTDSTPGRSLSFLVNTTSDGHDANPGNGTCADSAGKCTLRAAIEEANALPAGTKVAVTVRDGTYKLKLGTLAVTRNNIAITGAGPTATVFKGNGKSAVVRVAGKARASLIKLKLTNGGIARNDGGGLYNSGATNLANVEVTANTASSGGGIYNTSGATLDLTSSTVSANSAMSGADSQDGGLGGGIYNAGSLTLWGSTVTGNSSGNGGFDLNDTGGS
ncbi:MAG TPA: CSLREA domain-containing protein, partial [Chloroflexota bacterium]|nr:CSLREA domain-containing protein [Chloroflexota bacterium]